MVQCALVALMEMKAIHIDYAALLITAYVSFPWSADDHIAGCSVAMKPLLRMSTCVKEMEINAIPFVTWRNLEKAPFG